MLNIAENVSRKTIVGKFSAHRHGESARRAQGAKMLRAFAAAFAALLLVTQAGFAMFPPLPSSFYGQVKVNGANVPEGTVVRALINGKAYGETKTLMYEGSSVYALNVMGDETSTQEVDGGREGDPIQFEIGGVLAEETAQWKGATNVELNLSASGSAALIDPQQDAEPAPTQTGIIPDYATKTSAPAEMAGNAAPASIPIWLAGLVAAVFALTGAGWWLKRGKK